jgi:hypothetical protein
MRQPFYARNARFVRNADLLGTAVPPLPPPPDMTGDPAIQNAQVPGHSSQGAKTRENQGFWQVRNGG